MQELVANCDRFKTLNHSTSAPYAFTVFGASVKDMGNGLCAVTKLQASPETILGMLK